MLTTLLFTYPVACLGVYWKMGLATLDRLLGFGTLFVHT